MKQGETNIIREAGLPRRSGRTKEFRPMQSDGKMRPWREIAKELINETEPLRIQALSKELSQAIDAQGVGPVPKDDAENQDGQARRSR
jgi:hypothetical protein